MAFQRVAAARNRWKPFKSSKPRLRTQWQKAHRLRRNLVRRWCANFRPIRARTSF